MSAGRVLGTPATANVPRVGERIVVRPRIALVFPAPFVPSTPRICPRSTAKVRSSTATRPPYSLRTPRASTAGLIPSSPRRRLRAADERSMRPPPDLTGEPPGTRIGARQLRQGGSDGSHQREHRDQQKARGGVRIPR